MMLGDLGADVIKVERPGTGDETRGWGPPFDERGESAYFLSVNRNRKSVVADLGSDLGQELVRALALDADVVIDNFRPGILARAGLAPATIRSAQPGLVWMTITGFGDAGDRPGYDFVAQAECGWMAITGEPAGAPMKVGVALVDVIVAKDAAAAILAALVARGRTGVGATLSVSLEKSALAALVNVAQNSLVSGTEARRWGNAHPNLVPYELFEAADRPIVIAVGSDPQWLALVRALGLDALAGDARLATNAGRLEHRAQVVGAVAARIATRDARYWIETLSAAGVPCGVVRGVREALAGSGASPLTGVPSAAGGGVRYPPPRLDEHGDAIRSRGWRAFSD